MGEVRAFSTVEQAAGQIPEGRLPYITVGWVLARDADVMAYGDPEDDEPTWRLGVAIAEVADGCRDRSLSPPIPAELEGLVLLADEHVERMSDRGEEFSKRVAKILPGFHAVAAKLILKAVYEHGYRRDIP
jgi:hypothetical protein